MSIKQDSEDLLNEIKKILSPHVIVVGGLSKEISLLLIHKIIKSLPNRLYKDDEGCLINSKQYFRLLEKEISESN